MEERNNDNTLYTLSVVLFTQLIALCAVWMKGDSAGILDFLFRSLCYWIGLTVTWAIIFSIIHSLERYHLLEKKLGILYFLIAPIILLIVFAAVKYL